LLARQLGGTFILRIEDTDQTRYVPGAEDYIIEALTWLGISFDEGPHIAGGPNAPYRQSERKAQGVYRQYAEQLIANGHAYYAFDTDAELDAMRDRAKAGGMAFSYDYATRDHLNNSLTLPHDEVQRRLASGAPYVIRFKIPRKEEVRFHDTIRGWVNVATKELDDKVLLKSDGMPTYHLANIVDDRLMQITHVIRGEEWLPSTPLHVLMYQAFGWQHPEFAHLPLLLKPTGEGKLSKRDGDQHGFPVFPLQWRDPATGDTSSGYREEGYLPEALINFLALLGWHPSGDASEIMGIDDLIRDFSLDRVSKSGAKFNKEKLEFFNQHYLRLRPDTDFVPQLRSAYPASSRTDTELASLVALLKERMVRTTDLVPQARILLERPIAYDDAYRAKVWDAAFVEPFRELVASLPNVTDWTHDGLAAHIKSFAEARSVKQGKLMPMLRLAATGSGEGPGVLDILAWLGREESVARLNAAVAVLA
jgi:glutamyl-tRNA synthetase